MMPSRLEHIQVFTLMSLPRDYNDLHESGIGELRQFIELTDQCGLHGILVPESVNGYFHPWVVAQEVLSQSDKLSPLVAVNPVFAHPFTVAKQVATLTEFYNRKLFLNFITGTAKNDADRLGDPTDHDSRYKRLDEFIHIVYELWKSTRPVSFRGDFYHISNLQLPYNLPARLLPDICIAGSSEQALQLVRKNKGVNLKMAKPLSKILKAHNNDTVQGFHFGILARPTRAEAYQVLEKISPKSKERQLLQKFSMRNTDAVWKMELLQMAEGLNNDDGIFSVVQFQNFNSDVPYLVGDYESVAMYIQEYIAAGIKFFIVEVLQDHGTELPNIDKVFSLLAPQVVVD